MAAIGSQKTARMAKELKIGNGEWGMGNGEWGMGHWALGVGRWALGIGSYPKSGHGSAVSLPIILG